MKKVLFGLSVIVVICLIIGGVIMKDSSFFGLLNKPSEVDAQMSDEKVFESTNITYISIDNLHTDINLIPTKENNIKVQLYDTVSTNTEPDFKLFTNLENEKLHIEVQRKKKVSLSWKGKQRLDIYIPQNYSQDLLIKTSEGTTNISGFNLKNCEIEATSGHIITEALTADHAAVKNSSGRIEMIGFAGNLKAENTSGSITIKCKEFNSNTLSLRSNAGSVALQLPKNATFYLKAKALSGQVTCELPLEMKVVTVTRNKIEGAIGGGKNEIIINTGSGSIRVE